MTGTEQVGLCEVRVLGPVSAHGPDGEAELSGTRQRAVLGVLALHAGEVLPFHRLVEVLWGEDPPRTALRTLHSHVARIRQALAACGAPPVLGTRESGYLLDLPAGCVDAHRFAELVATARRDLAGGAPERAAQGLRATLELWRGEPFAGAALVGWGEHEVERLRELRRSAVEDLWEAEIRCGGHEAAALELPRLVAQDPTRERLVGLQMLALYRCNRHTDALEVYGRLRHTLAEEFGVDPGPEVAALHTAILRREPVLDPPPPAAAAAPVPPRQLPARVGHFTGRGAELAALDEVLATADEPPIVVITGPAGMGKTSLAVQWGHRVVDRFPDGQLFVDLRGQDPRRAVPAHSALAHLLRVLDVPDDRIPAEPDERAALYRSLLHGRRCLVVLDNAGSVEDVLRLVPGGDGNLLVVTSRLGMAALAARHATRVVVVDALRDDEAVSLLGNVVGGHRVERESGSAARLARLCGGMPLALRIAAARLLGDPARPIAEFAAELTGPHRLDGLVVDGDSRTVRTVLASAYEPLPAGTARVFGRLGLHPGPTFSTHLGAALGGLSPADGRRAVAELAASHLVTRAGTGRFRFHDLIRDFARQSIDVREPGCDVTDRLVDWYLAVADAANRLVDPERDQVTPVVRHVPTELPFTDKHSALAFLEAERGNLVPVVQQARAGGHLTAAWQLTYLLTSFYDATGHWHERVELCKQGAAAAAELGEPAAEAEMLRALGVAHSMTRRLHDALTTSEQALRVAHTIDDVVGQGHIHNNMGNTYAELRRFDEAVTAHLLAVERCATAGHALGKALSQRNLGHTYTQMGRAESAFTPLHEALAGFRELGHGRLEAGTLDALGEAHLQTGEQEKALEHFHRALTICRDIGDRWLEWETLLDIGIAHLDLDNHDQARHHFEEALTISREVGDRHGESCALGHLGRAHLLAGDLTAAQTHLEAAQAIRERVPDHFEEAHLHRDLAEVAQRREDPTTARHHRETAARLYTQANATAEAESLLGP
ncbi:putative regulatory protein [Actinokineospora spheciospongiae]|uniref:Putative regulatory protein n=1 Tax=Actinokineospora spheciospongiae TaxID=909613 RepID=W7J1N4_9PSEU|nr:BTAD domain-containing putative transcriptional regulator [Actinokineospora spheciospongiae]EWC62962.1 putative regulatory protein [Actinokineospora spheciospongiae]